LPESRVILWRNLDAPGFERAVLSQKPGGWQLRGTVLIALPDAIEVRYRVDCNVAWQTRTVYVELESGDEQQTLDLRVEPSGGWLKAGDRLELGPDIVDVDLSVSPVTNTLPIRRLGLGVGESRDIAVAWVRFPELSVERHDQTYERLAENVYRFTEGDFKADLEVDDLGLVVAYPGLWDRV
jgi:uncharacterized protein